jgi:hypothetical protein
MSTHFKDDFAVPVAPEDECMVYIPSFSQQSEFTFSTQLNHSLLTDSLQLFTNFIYLFSI